MIFPLSPYPSLSGNRDSLVLSLDTLPGIEQHSSIWFTVKAEDENQNRSVLGNSPSLDYRLAPNDLKATPEQVYHVNLTWQGRKAAGFQHYNIYRKAGAEPFTMITDTVTMGAFTDNLYDAPDAGYQYAVQAVYTQGSSDSVFSDIVDIQRFINLMILCQLEDTTIYDSITFTMQGQDTVYSMSFNRTTNLTGLVMLPAVYFGDYVINISRSGYQSIHDTISVTPGNPSWSFTLLSLTKPRLFSGRVHYDNNASTPLGNIKVYLKNLSNTILDSTMTISTGDFSFSAIPGDYRIGFKCTKPSGGINSIDALLILKHFVGIDTLKGIKLTAADVDGSGNINASDALITMRRFVGLVSTFSVGDWIFENPLIVLSPDENNVLIFKGLCTGDVNGSYTP
ncbi:MAG: dockerin type I domain-containing protein [Bacteroidetes bacterium]|nr:dockerin type I domain-containing protein [Bacteroidota bacterium]